LVCRTHQKNWGLFWPLFEKIRNKNYILCETPFDYVENLILGLGKNNWQARFSPRTALCPSLIYLNISLTCLHTYYEKINCLFFRRKANPNQRDNCGVSCLDVAKKSPNSTKIVQVLMQLYASLLLEGKMRVGMSISNFGDDIRNLYSFRPMSQETFLRTVLRNLMILSDRFQLLNKVSS